MSLWYFELIINSNHLPQAGRLRNYTAAAFSVLKKYASHFFNFAIGETTEKEAAYVVIGGDSEEISEINIILIKIIRT